MITDDISASTHTIMWKYIYKPYLIHHNVDNICCLWSFRKHAHNVYKCSEAIHPACEAIVVPFVWHKHWCCFSVNMNQSARS